MQWKKNKAFVKKELHRKSYSNGYHNLLNTVKWGWYGHMDRQETSGTEKSTKINVYLCVHWFMLEVKLLEEGKKNGLFNKQSWDQL